MESVFCSCGMGITERSEDRRCGGADGDLAWNESAAFLYTGTDKVDWSDCNLVVNSDWMVPGRRDRICYLQYMNKKAKMSGINPAHFLYSIYQNR